MLTMGVRGPMHSSQNQAHRVAKRGSRPEMSRLTMAREPMATGSSSHRGVRSPNSVAHAR